MELQILTDEQLMGDFCKFCDYSLEDCIEHDQQKTCPCYQGTLEARKEQATQQARLTLRQVVEWLDEPCPHAKGIPMSHLWK
jgi:hypothetical protein